MTNQTPSAKFLLNPVHFLALGLGSGLSRFMPGTMGTIVAVLLWSLVWAVLFPGVLNIYLHLGILVVTTILGIYLCGETAKNLGVHDHGGIVWDEFVGYWLALLALPLTWQWLLAAFVLFRFFDIVKPWPIRQIDKNVHGGWGIMLDDLLAGAYTLALLHAFKWAFL